MEGGEGAGKEWSNLGWRRDGSDQGSTVQQRREKVCMDYQQSQLAFTVL